MYFLTTPYRLRPSSSVRLPLINIIPPSQFYYQAMINIRNGESQGVFQHYYEIISNQFLPAGIVTIRDHQILIGQSNLSDILHIKFILIKIMMFVI